MRREGKRREREKDKFDFFFFFLLPSLQKSLSFNAALGTSAFALFSFVALSLPLCAQLPAAAHSPSCASPRSSHGEHRGARRETRGRGRVSFFFFFGDRSMLGDESSPAIPSLKPDLEKNEKKKLHPQSTAPRRAPTPGTPPSSTRSSPRRSLQTSSSRTPSAWPSATSPRRPPSISW